MTDKKWNDREIENLLGSIPDVKDNRSKSDILARLKRDERIQQTHRKSKMKWVPTFVAIAALLLLSVLVTPLFQNDGASDLSLKADEEISFEKESGSQSRIMDQDSSAKESAAVTDEKTSATLFSNKNVLAPHYAVYPSEVTGFTVWHLGLAGDAAVSVPVSFLIPEAQIKADFGNTKPTSLDLYTVYAERLDETTLGFSEYHPYKGDFEVVGKSIVHRIPIGHGYDQAPASLEVFTNSLQDTFYGFKELLLKNKDGTMVEFDQVGEPSKPLKLTSGMGQLNYYLYEQTNGMQFLTSNFGKTYESLEDALEDMKNTPNDIFTSVIPEDINYEVILTDSYSIVKFKEQLDLDILEPAKAMQLVEGLLLTGASFGEQLQFENVKQSDWNGFNFSKPLPIPLGANPQPFLLK